MTMDELVTELREMFRRREGDLPWALDPPPGLRARVRRRQAGTLVLAAAIAAAAMGGALLAGRAALDRSGTYVPAEGGRERTAHVPGLVVTYPEGWRLAVYVPDEGRGPTTTVLANFELDPSDRDPCGAIPPGGVALLVTSPAPGPATAPWPVRLLIEPAPERCPGVEGGVTWRIDDGRTYAAWAVAGPAASELDRASLLESFAGLRFDSGIASGSSGAVVASGVVHGRPWTLFARPGRTPEGPSLGVQTGQEGGGLSGDSFGAVEVRAPTEIALSAPVMHGVTYLYGGVPGAVARVRVEPGGAEAFDAPIFDLPSSLGTDVRAFVAPMLGAPRGSVTTYDAAGTVLTRVRFAPGESCWSPERPCSRAPISEGVLAEGTAGGIGWRIVAQGGTLRLLDERGAELASVEGTPAPILLRTVTLGAGPDALQIPLGLAAPGTTSVVLVSSGLSAPASAQPLADGTVAFWAPVSPPDPGAVIVAFDAGCRVVGTVEVATGEPAGAPAGIPCSP